MTRQFNILFIIILVIGLSIGCQGPGSDTEEENRIPVETAAVSLGQVYQTLNYNGDINAEFEVRVYSKIPDRIESYFVDDGDRISRNAPIAKILSATVEQAVRQAEAGLTASEAQLANMDSEYKRAQRLFKEDAMSRQEFDAMETQYQATAAQLTQARAALATASSQLDDATVTAPISGIIGKRYFEAGDMASPGLPVASVVQMDRVKIKFEATEKDLGRLAIGQKAEVRVRSYPDETFTGELVKISPVLDPMTRMITVEVLIPNPDHRLKPGMYAEAKITTGVLDQIIVIPRHVVIESTSLKKIDGKDQVVKDYYVYVVDDSSRAVQRLLDVRYVNHQSIAVNSGVAIDEKLVISGQNNLRDGMPVLIIADEEVE